MMYGSEFVMMCNPNLLCAKSARGSGHSGGNGVAGISGTGETLKGVAVELPPAPMMTGKKICPPVVNVGVGWNG
jgi:hypothetical protein